MKAVLQRVSWAAVRSGDEVLGEIKAGLLVLLAIGEGDTVEAAKTLAARIVNLRVFEDEGGKMNLSVASIGGAVLCVSQFTLYGDVRRGTRPSFDRAARPDLALALYDRFCESVAAAGIRCERGRFGAKMEVTLENDGPVTLVVDTDDFAAPRRTPGKRAESTDPLR